MTGSQAWHLLRLVMMNGVRLAVAGVAIGLTAAVALTRAMTSLLYETSITDVVTFSITAGSLVLVTALACYLPARRAARVDARIVMQTE